MPAKGDVNLSDVVTQADAAKLRGVSRAAISDLIKRGRLTKVDIGGKIFLYRSEVSRFEPQVGGRPPTKKAPPPRKKAPRRKRATRAST